MAISYYTYSNCMIDLTTLPAEQRLDLSYNADVHNLNTCTHHGLYIQVVYTLLLLHSHSSCCHRLFSTDQTDKSPPGLHLKHFLLIA